MSTSNAKITFFAGNYKKLSFTITDSDNGGAALNLTTLDVKWAMSAGNASAYATSPSLEKSEGSGITITDAANGLCEVVIDSADTVNFLGDYYWELEVTDATSESSVVAYGEFTIKANVENT